ncbi:MAG: stage V sporulation protein T, partial [Clostridia bacterium]|nr:stage V sporulation protein T [Clostridia bacterium]
IGEMTGFAAQYAETLHKTCSMAVVICDRDAVIACAGIPKKEYTDRKLSAELEKIIENRTLYTADGNDDVPVVDGGACLVSCAMPIITEGDITGCVASVFSRTGDVAQLMNGELETKLIQTAAGFLGRQLEG